MRPAVILATVAILGAGCSQPSGDPPMFDPASTPYPAPSPGDAVLGPPYPTNSSGMTYGSGLGPDDPDLIAAYGTNGQLGYVRATDLHQPVASSLQTTPAALPRSITLFAKDGVTPIGEYRSRGGSTRGLAVGPVPVAGVVARAPDTSLIPRT